MRQPKIGPLIGGEIDPSSVIVPPQNRGLIKQTLIALGFPVHDIAGYVDGDPMPVALRPQCRGGAQFVIREYQVQASESYVGNERMPGGSGVVVLPCGAGKTIVGLYVMSLLKRRTLILVTNVTASHQWKRELLDKTDLPRIRLANIAASRKIYFPSPSPPTRF